MRALGERGQAAAPPLVAVLGHLLPVVRGEPPVLAARVKAVRRRARAVLHVEDVRMHPGVHAALVHACAKFGTSAAQTHLLVTRPLRTPQGKAGKGTRAGVIGGQVFAQVCSGRQARSSEKLGSLVTLGCGCRAAMHGSAAGQRYRAVMQGSLSCSDAGSLGSPMGRSPLSATRCCCA